jgi:hypothetical protein
VTLTVTIAVPLRPSTVLTVIVREAPLPAKFTLLIDTSGGSGLDKVALSVSLAAELSTSPTVRLTVPEWSSLPQVPPAATLTVGESLRAVTVRVTSAESEARLPSLAR